MFSKRVPSRLKGSVGLFVGSTVSALLLSLLACTPKVGEAPPPVSSPQVQGMGCLNDAAMAAKQFMLGEARDADLANGWDCAVTAFTQFRVVRGSASDSYTPAEVAKFLEDNFLEAEPNRGRPAITPDLQREFMKLKQIFVGGRQDLILRAEISKTIDLLRTLKTLTLALNPYMRIFVLKWNPKEAVSREADLEFFEKANLQLQTAARQLGALIQANHPAYKFDDLISFLEQMSKFYGEDWPFIDNVRKFMPVAKKVKTALAGGSENEIQPSEWKTILLMGGRGYVQFLRYRYFIEAPNEAGKTLRLAYVARTFEDAFSVFEDLVREKAGGVVTRKEMDGITAAFAKAWPDFKISDGLTNEFMKVKVLLFGGTREQWAVADFETARLKVSKLKGIFEGVLPYYTLYAGDWSPKDETPEEAKRAFTEAQNALEKAGADLGALLESPYDIEDVGRFVDEFEKLYPPRTGQQAFGVTVRKYLPLARQLKNTVVNDQDSIVKKDQWSPFLAFSTRAYMIYLYQTYFVASVPEGLESLQAGVRLADHGLSLLADIAAKRSGGVLPHQDLDRLILRLSALFPDFHFSSVLGGELMKLKVALLGGSAVQWTVAELQSARGKSGKLTDILTQLWPYKEILGGSWSQRGLKPDEAEQKFAEAKKVLEQALSELAGQFESSYDLNRVTVLVTEYERLYPPAKPADSIKVSLDKYWPLVRELKFALFERKNPVIEKNQWAAFLPLVGRLYVSSLYSDYFLKDRDQRQLSTLASLRKFGDGLLDLAKEFLAAKPSHILTQPELLGIAQALQKAEFLPADLNPESLQQVLDAVLNRVFNPPEKRLAGERPNSVRAASVEYIRKEFRTWVDTQSFLSAAFQSGDDRYLTPEQLWKVLQGGIASPKSSPELKAGLSELLLAVNTPVHLIVDTLGRMVIASQIANHYNLRTMERLNIVRQVARIFIASYAGEMSRIRNYQGVNLNEAQTAFQNFRPLAVKMGLIDQNNQTFMENRFREANIFMPRSDGDGYASFHEIVDMLSGIFSGLTMDEQLRPALLKDCWQGGGKPTTSSVVPYNCLYTTYVRQFPFVMSAMPNLTNYQRSQSNEVFNGFFYNSLKAAGYVPDGKYMVKFEDIALLPHLLQYTELIYARFDLNNDGVIDVAEARKAFPSFKSLFKELAKKELADGTIKESELLALFTYILRYGKPPSGIWDGLTRWFPWRDRPESWKVAADRTLLAQILGYIADELAKPSNKEQKFQMIPTADAGTPPVETTVTPL